MKQQETSQLNHVQPLDQSPATESRTPNRVKTVAESIQHVRNDANENPAEYADDIRAHKGGE